VHLDDFFCDDHSPTNPFGTPTRVLRDDVLAQLRAGPLPNDDDLDTAIALTHLVHSELQKYGTGGGETFSDSQIEAAQRALRSVLGRHGIDLRLPWRDFGGFRTYWLNHDGHNSWQARREMLHEFFGPVETELDRLEEIQLGAVVAEGVSPHSATGWTAVDAELTELKRRFRSASTPQDYRDVGNRAVAVLEALSGTVYDPKRHLRPDEEEPPVANIKQRLERYVEESLGGADNVEVRGLAKKVIVLAQAVKHQPSSRRDAGITADAVILLANILRRVDQDI